MRITCIHCSQRFAISVHQLGADCPCPHCGQQLHLPGVDEPASDAAEVSTAPNHWWENSVSSFASLIFHLALVLILGLISYGGESGEGLSEEVLIGTLPSEILSDQQDDELDSSEQVEQSQEADQLDEELDIAPPVSSTSQTSLDSDISITAPTASGGSRSSFDLGSVSIGGGSMAGGSWDGMLQTLRRNGLDIVIVFDSTGSMGQEIKTVKRQIGRIGGVLIRLVPKARIGLCTYRDHGDEYLVRGMQLTNSLEDIENWLSEVEASGGGSYPESVHSGLNWAVENNEFRPKARKVILLFGDAPPNSLRKCLQIASDFNSQQKGVVSTVTCRAGTRLNEFIEIAEVGGGEAFLTADERQLMTQLMVLVFGSQYRGKVVEAFKLLGS